MSDLNKIIDKIKKIENLNDDKEVAKLLGVRPDTLSQQKIRNSIPYKNIINYANLRNVSLSWLLNDKGEEYINEKQNNGINLNNNSGKIKGVIGHNNGTVNINVNKIKDNKEAMDIIELLQYADDEILHKIKTNLTKLKEVRELF